MLAGEAPHRQPLVGSSGLLWAGSRGIGMSDLGADDE